MKDRVVQYPNRYKLVPVAGQADTYDLVAEPGTITEEGTQINKANLLGDATAALYGLSGDNSTVNKALETAITKFFIDNGKSLSANGYAKISSIIIQWGTSLNTGATFPIAFPTGCWSVTDSGFGNVTAVSNTGFTVTNRYGYVMNYIAIGY